MKIRVWVLVGSAIGVVQLRIDDLGDAEIQQFRLSGTVHQDVAGLDVPVDDPVLVRELHRPADLHKQAQPFAGRQAVGIAIAVDGLAIDVLHDEVGAAVFRRAAVEQARNIGMLEAGEDFPLGAKAAQDVISVEPAAQQLDRHLLAELSSAAHRQVHAAHSAPAEFPDDPVIPDQLTADRRGLAARRRPARNRNRDRRMIEKIARLAMGVDQRLDFAPQFRVAVTGPPEEALAFGQGQVEGLLEHGLDPLPPLRGHFSSLPLSSR